MNLEAVAKDWIPPRLRRVFNRLGGYHTRYSGPFESFDAALSNSGGYSDPSISAQLMSATQQVLSGRATYAQDGRAFREAPPPQDALSGVLLARALSSDPFSVLDVGGGMASHYLRWRPFLERINLESWDIIEQLSVVQAGQTLFPAHRHVRFHQAMADVAGSPAVAILSSVLQYLREPDGMLAEVVDKLPLAIVVDRTPFCTEDRTVHLVQHNPTGRGSRDSYPITVFPTNWLDARLSERYAPLTRFPSPDAPVNCGSIKAPYSGSLWIRRN